MYSLRKSYLSQLPCNCKKSSKINRWFSVWCSAEVVYLPRPREVTRITLPLVRSEREHSIMKVSVWCRDTSTPTRAALMVSTGGVNLVAAKDGHSTCTRSLLWSPSAVVSARVKWMLTVLDIRMWGRCDSKKTGRSFVLTWTRCVYVCCARARVRLCVYVYVYVYVCM